MAIIIVNFASFAALNEWGSKKAIGQTIIAMQWDIINPEASKDAWSDRLYKPIHVLLNIPNTIVKASKKA